MDPRDFTTGEAEAYAAGHDAALGKAADAMMAAERKWHAEATMMQAARFWGNAGTALGGGTERAR